MQTGKKRLFFALGLSVLAATMGWAYLFVRERQLLGSSESVRILVAHRYIPALTRLEAGQLTVADIPRAFVPKGAVTDHRSILGQQTLVPFNPGEPILYNKLAEAGQNLSASVPEGKRAVSIPVDAVSGVSGLLQPGDHVDALLLHGTSSASQAGLLLQDVTVLAVGTATRAGQDQRDNAGTVTLALNPEEAGLVLVAGAQGRLHLGLRASGDARSIRTGRVTWSDVARRMDRPASAPMADLPPPAAGSAEFVPRKRGD